MSHTIRQSSRVRARLMAKFFFFSNITTQYAYQLCSARMLGTYAWHHHQPHHAASMPCTTVPVVATRRHTSPPLMSNPSPSTTNIAVVYISVGILSLFLLEILGLLIANGRRCVFSCVCVQLCPEGVG